MKAKSADTIDVKAIFFEGNILFTEGEYVQAEECLTQLKQHYENNQIVKDTTYIRTLFRLALISNKKGTYETSVQIFDNIIKCYSDNSLPEDLLKRTIELKLKAEKKIKLSPVFEQETESQVGLKPITLTRAQTPKSYNADCANAPEAQKDSKPPILTHAEKLGRNSMQSPIHDIVAIKPQEKLLRPSAIQRKLPEPHKDKEYYKDTIKLTLMTSPFNLPPARMDAIQDKKVSSSNIR